jgi:hypothetical protein
LTIYPAKHLVFTKATHVRFVYKQAWSLFWGEHVGDRTRCARASVWDVIGAPIRTQVSWVTARMRSNTERRGWRRPVAVVLVVALSMTLTGISAGSAAASARANPWAAGAGPAQPTTAPPTAVPPTAVPPTALPPTALPQTTRTPRTRSPRPPTSSPTPVATLTPSTPVAPVVGETAPDSDCSIAGPDDQADPAAACSPPPVQVRSYQVRMNSDVGHAVPGGLVRYSVDVRSTGLIDYTAADPAVVSVDLAGLLDDAAVRSVTGHSVRAGAALSWSLALAAGAGTSVSFTVRVDVPDSGDRVLRASVVTPVGSGGNCPTGSSARECSPIPVGVASFTMALHSDVANVNPGETVNYTITAADLNTTVKNTAVVIGLDVAGVRVSSKQVSVAVAVSRSHPASAGSVLTGSNSTLLLIAIGTLLAAVGLLGLAGFRRRGPVPSAS